MNKPKITWLSWLSVLDQNKHREKPNCIYAGYSKLIPDKIKLRLDITKAKEEFCVICEGE